MPTSETVTDVFTPSVPATASFVEREQLNRQLVDSLRTPGKQIIVYGPSGSGKSTLIANKLKQIYPDHITTRCTAGSTYHNLLLAAFDKLEVFYASEISITKKKHLAAKLSGDYFGIKASIEAAVSRESSLTEKRIVPPQLTAQHLAEFFGAVESCWLIEDLHKVPVPEKALLAQMMKVFTDTAADYPAVKILATGAVDSARDVVQYDPEMRNRIAEIAVPLMTETEREAIITKGEQLLNVKFGRVKGAIATYSSGLGAVCHQLCLNICLAADIYETCSDTVTFDSEQLSTALQTYLRDASDTLKAVFDAALRQKRVKQYHNTKLIIEALTEVGSAGATHAELLRIIRKKEKNYPPGNLTNYLQEMQGASRRSIVRSDGTSGRYFFSDPLYLAYSQCFYSHHKPSLQPASMTDLTIQISQELEKLLLRIGVTVK